MPFKELKPDEWLTEIKHGLEFRKRFGLEQLWGQMEAIYYNVHHSMMNDGPNIFLSQGDAMLSTLTVPHPKVKVTARTKEGVDKAPLVESISNLLLEEMDLPLAGERATLLAFLFGVGFIKHGYDSEWGFDPSQDIGGNLQLGFTLTQMDGKGKRMLEHDSKVSPGMPWARAVMPHDIVVPWGTVTLDDTPWIAHRVVRRLDDLKDDPKYKNTSRLIADLSMRDFVESYKTQIHITRSTSTQESEFIEIWEIHDKRTGKIYAVTPNHDKFLRRETNALQINGRLPFTSISFTPSTRSLWTTPDAYYLYHIQNELSDVAVQRTKQRRLASLKFLYNADAISDEELAKLLSPDVGAAAKVEGVGKISDVIIRLDNQVNQMLGIEEEHLRQNAREQMGFSRNQIGEFTGGRKTATEVATVQQSSQLRMSRRGLRMQRLYEDSIQITNAIIFKHWTTLRYIEVLGREGAERWQSVSGPGMSGKYKYTVELVDAAELRQRKFEALQLYSVLSQDPTIDPVGLRLFLVNEVNDPGFERIFNADVQLAMSVMRQQQGVVQQTNAGQQQTAGVRNGQLSGSAGQGSLGSTSRLLAGGRANA